MAIKKANHFQQHRGMYIKSVKIKAEKGVWKQILKKLKTFRTFKVFKTRIFLILYFKKSCKLVYKMAWERRDWKYKTVKLISN